MDGRGGLSERGGLDTRAVSNGAAFMDERRDKDRSSVLAHRDRGRPGDERIDEAGEGASKLAWSTALDAFRCQWPARLRRQRGGVPRSTSTAGVPTAEHLALARRSAGGSPGAKGGRFVAKRGQARRAGCTARRHGARSRCSGRGRGRIHEENCMARAIAIVEDEPSIRANYVEALSRIGYDVRGCASRGEASGAFANRMPELVIIDIGLGDEPEDR